MQTREGFEEKQLIVALSETKKTEAAYYRRGSGRFPADFRLPLSSLTNRFDISRAYQTGKAACPASMTGPERFRKTSVFC